MPVFIDYPIEGVVTNPFDAGGVHGGVDLDGGNGTPIYAPTDGTLLLWPQGTQGDGSFGNAVDIQTDDGWTVKMAHMDRFADGLISGYRVQAGTRIGYQGYTGYTIPAGPGGGHVHWGMCRISSFPRYTESTKYLFDDPSRYIISAGERMALFARLENIEKMLGGFGGDYRIAQWVSSGNISILDCLGQNPAKIGEITMKWDGIEQQTYGTNQLLLSWREAARSQNIILP